LRASASAARDGMAERNAWDARVERNERSRQEASRDGEWRACLRMATAACAVRRSRRPGGGTGSSGGNVRTPLIAICRATGAAPCAWLRRQGRSPIAWRAHDARALRHRRRCARGARLVLRFGHLRHGRRDDPAWRPLGVHGRGAGHGPIRCHSNGGQRLARCAMVPLRGLAHCLAFPDRLACRAKRPSISRSGSCRLPPIYCQSG
jgi:hypothetical protein